MWRAKACQLLPKLNRGGLGPEMGPGSVTLRVATDPEAIVRAGGRMRVGTLHTMPRHGSRHRREFDFVFYSPWMSHLLSPRAGVPPGGAETQVRALAVALAQRGLRVAVIVDDVPGLPNCLGGVAIIPQRKPGRVPRFIRLPARIWFAWRALASTSSEVYMQRGAATITALVGVYARLHGKRFVFSSANVTDFRWRRIEPHASVRCLYALGLRLATDVVVQTAEQVTLARERLGREPLLLRSIAEHAEEGPVDPTAFLWIGRLEEPKNPEAFLRLAESLPEARFRMVGVAPTATAAQVLERLRPAMSALPNLEFVEGRPRSEVDQLYRAAVAVVSTSIDYEGMPNVLLEGWSRGVPALVLQHDPDGLIDEHQLGWTAGGSETRFADHARSVWGRRQDLGDLPARCRAYVTTHHAPGNVAAGWEHALLRRRRGPVRVLQVLTQDTIGGTELMVVELGSRLDPARVEVEVALFARGGPISTALARRGLAVHTLGSGILSIGRLTLLLRGGHYDVIHAYGFKGPMLARVLRWLVSPKASLLVGVQSVVPAEAEPESVKGRLTLRLEGLTTAWVDAYEANSRGALRRLERAGVPSRKLRYIPNGIDASTWPASKDRFSNGSMPIVTCIGRFIPRKRQSDLIRAVALLTQWDVNCQLVLAGDGPMLGEAKGLAHSLGLGDAVSFRGTLDRDGVRALLRDSRVYVQPSSYEGMPATVLEAMASGLAVVGTCTNGIEDLVVNDETGFLVPPGDVAALASRIRELLRDPARCEAMGEAARIRVAEEFDLVPVVESKTALMLALAANQQRGPE